MSFAATTILSLGSSKTGLTDLRLQPLTAAGVAAGAAIAAGFTEQGRGIYTWSGNVPDNAVAAKCTSVGNAAVLDVALLVKGVANTIAPDNAGIQATRAAAEATLAAIASIVGTGGGDTDVDHNTGGVDRLRYDVAGVGIGQAEILAYVKSEYDAGSRVLRARTTTGDDGRWAVPMRLSAGVAYVLRFEKSGEFGPDFSEVTP